MSVRERARDHQKGGISFLIETDACRLVARPCSTAAQQCQVKLAAVNKRTLRPGGFIRDNRPHLSKLTALHTSTLDFQTHTCMVDTLHSPLFQIMTPSEKSHQVQGGACIRVCVWVSVCQCMCVLALSVLPVRTCVMLQGHFSKHHTNYKTSFTSIFFYTSTSLLSLSIR